MKERYPELRWRVLAICFSIAFMLVFLRLGWVQVVRGGHWKHQARISSTELETLPARRGRILDRRGQVLVRTEILASVGVAHPQKWLLTKHPARVASLISMTESELRRRLAGRDAHTVLVKDAPLDGPTRYELSTIPNMSIELRTRRIRPHGEMAHQLLGNVSKVGEGVSGLERIFESQLAGTDGRALVRQDASENARARIVVDKPVDGADLTTTLDLRVQSILERELEKARVLAQANAAQGIVLEVSSGEVVALAQAPYNTPAPDGTRSVDRWRVMAATDEFEPGSVFKIFSLATLLNESVVDTATVFDGMGREGDYRVTHVFPNGRKIRDVHPVGRVSMRHAFITSSNIIFAKAVDERLKMKEFDDAIRAYGFTARPGTGFIGEADGLLIARERWRSYMMQSLAMGQGISVTLLQLASGSAAVLGDGSLRAPLFARELVTPDGDRQVFQSEVRRQNVVTERTTALLRSVARDVVHQDYGTGDSARVAGLSIAGKTSTAQVSTSSGYVQGIYTPTFVGAIPAEDPRLIVVIVLHGAPGERTYGGNTAAPCFAKVVREIAARTPWLEGAFRVSQVQAGERVAAPALVGHTADQVRQLCEAVSLRVDLPEQQGALRAVGQMPPAGAPMPPGGRIQVAWAGGS